MKTRIFRHKPQTPWTYRELDAYQKNLIPRILAGEPGELLLSEVAPVITVGRRTPASDLLLTPGDLQSQGVDLYPTDRGGLATYHGPGQWVLFPVDRLEALVGDTRGVRKTVDVLLESALETMRPYLPEAQISMSEGRVGVWNRDKKIASVGIHIQDGVLQHGLSLNVFKTRTSFMGIRPCGHEPQVGYLLDAHYSDPQALEREFTKIGESLISRILERFWKS